MVWVLIKDRAKFQLDKPTLRRKEDGDGSVGSGGIILLETSSILYIDHWERINLKVSTSVHAPDSDGTRASNLLVEKVWRPCESDGFNLPLTTILSISSHRHASASVRISSTVLPNTMALTQVHCCRCTGGIFRTFYSVLIFFITLEWFRALICQIVG